MKQAARLVLYVCLLTVGGCGMTARQQLSAAHNAGKMARQVVDVPTFCRPAVEKCKELRAGNPDDPCAVLSKCHAAREKITTALMTLQRAVLVGYLALDVKDAKTTSKAVSDAVAALVTIRAALADWGL